VWEQLPQTEDAVPAPPNGGAGAPAGAYLGATGGDALSSTLPLTKRTDHRKYNKKKLRTKMDREENFT
jgi:hypothetical protein